MCGIIGFISLRRSIGLSEEITRMVCKLSHRGPDRQAVWTDDIVGLALGHSRLAIQDISPAGDQPMVSDSGNFVIIFNGEIYNHLDLRNVLISENKKIDWKGTSDTETLLACVEAWGLDITLKRCSGMFALALWDKCRKILTIARDRLGEKPLYYGWQGESFIFGSELKPFKENNDFIGDINREALALYVRFNYVPAPFSIYKDIKKLPAGTYLELHFDGVHKSAPVVDVPIPYWSLVETADKASRSRFQGNDEELVNELDKLLIHTVASQMLSDVPLGAFLSGGVDSSTIVSMMQACSKTPVNTFTIGFEEQGYNEAENGKLIASHLGTNHTELYISSEDARNVIPLIPTLYDEPFADSSQIPTYLVSKLASQHVKVALTGDGGDELFGGYNRHLWLGKLWRNIDRSPRFISSTLGRGLSSVSPEVWDAVFNKTKKLLPEHYRVSQFGNKMHKLGDLFSSSTVNEMYGRVRSFWNNEHIVIADKNKSERNSFFSSDSILRSGMEIEEQIMLCDALDYLPNDILAKVDRAAMGVSMETRVPFLDHKLIEFAWRLPPQAKIRNKEGKWILRRVLDRYVPSALMDQPKMGFAVPVGEWLRGPLREWAENLLSESRLNDDGFFYLEPIRKKWKQHLNRDKNWEHDLWGILMFQVWLDENR